MDGCHFFFWSSLARASNCEESYSITWVRHAILNTFIMTLCPEYRYVGIRWTEWHLLLTYKDISQNAPPLGSQVAAFSCLTQLNLLWNLRTRERDPEYQKSEERGDEYHHSQQEMLSERENHSRWHTHRRRSRPLKCWKSPVPSCLQGTNRGTSAGRWTAEPPHIEAAQAAKPAEIHTWYSHLKAKTDTPLALTRRAIIVDHLLSGLQNPNKLQSV